MIERRHIGTVRPARTIAIEPAMIARFAEAVGETSPAYFCEEAARAAGFQSIPIPPTYLACLDVLVEGSQSSIDFMTSLGINLSLVVHGEQEIWYERAICAGEEITFFTRVVDIFSKQDGKLEFVVQETEAVDESGSTVGGLRCTYIVKN